MPVYRVLMEYQVTPGKEQDFEEAARSTISHVLNQVPGHQRTQVYKPVGGGEVYLVQTEWDAQESFDAWRRSPGFATAAQRWRETGAVLEGPREVPREALQAVKST